MSDDMSCTAADCGFYGDIGCEEEAKPIGRSTIVRFPESEVAALTVGETVVTLKLTAGPCVFEALGQD